MYTSGDVQGLQWETIGNLEGCRSIRCGTLDRMGAGMVEVEGERTVCI